MLDESIYACVAGLLEVMVKGSHLEYPSAFAILFTSVLEVKDLDHHRKTLDQKDTTEDG